MSSKPSVNYTSAVYTPLSLAMYFKKLAFVTSLVTLAVATPAPVSSSCSTGPVQCCNSVQPASSSAVTTLLGLLGVVLQDVNVNVGITCSPITVSIAL